MNQRHPRTTALLLAAVLLIVLPACSKTAEGGAIKRPPNVSTKAEQLAAAPTSVVADTPDWTELPKPIADAFAASLDKGKFQAFAAMKQITVSVRLKAAPADKDVFAALDAASAFVPEDYSLLMNIYAPGSDGKDRYAGYEWTPLSGVLVKKGSADADQGWDSAITAITEGSVTEMLPPAVKQIAQGQTPPPLFK